MVNPVQCSNKSLPTTFDLIVNVTKVPTITGIGLNIPVFITPESPLNGSLTPGAGRILYYSTLNSVADDWGTEGEAYKAAREFFSQSPRPPTLAIAQIFTTPQTGSLITGLIGTLPSFVSVADGEFSVTIDGVQADVTGLDFTTALNYDDVATVIQAGLVSAGFAGATVTPIDDGGQNFQMQIFSGTSGDGSSVSTLSTIATPVGTDISGANNDFLNGQNGETILGYTPTGLANEMSLVQEASICNGRFVYAWVIDHVYSETAEQINAAAWVEAQDAAVLFADSNNPIALDAGDTSSNMLTFNLNDYSKSFFLYTHTYDFYGVMSFAAYMLHVDYNGENTTVTAKFKNAPGVPPTPVTESETNVILSKRGNVFAVVGNNVRALREGTTSSNNWFLDDRINVDNYVNDIKTGIFNVYTRNGKLPYTPTGIAKLRQAETSVSEKYVTNGTIADLIVRDETVPSGQRTIPAYSIEFPDIGSISDVDRAARFLPGNTIILQLSGAIHKLELNIIVQS